MITKTELDKLVEKYEIKEFIEEDPIQFCHKFERKEDIEIIGFVASLVSYGSRKVFIGKIYQLLELMDYKPYDFILNFNLDSLNGFNYRFGKEQDFVEIFNILHELYAKDNGLESLFKKGYERGNMFQEVTDYFYSRASDKAGAGFYYMIPNASCGGAMKRMCMFLRWMVRPKPVDFGVWNFIKPSELLIPLDVHVARISREMKLLKRNSNDMKAVIELTENLRKFDPVDPIKYDFAMFMYGIDRNKKLS